MMRRLIMPVLLVVHGCGDDVGPATQDTESEGSGSTTASTSSASTSSATGDTGSSSGEPESSSSGVFEPPVEECGNGYVEGDEHCDDANMVDDDTCTNTCQFRCGLEWSETVSPPTGESLIDPRALVRDADDNVIVAGFLREVTTDQKGNETAADDEVLVVKLASDGTEIWRREIGEATGDLVVGGVTVDDAGDVFITATGNGPNDDDDMFVYKLAGADGEPSWTHTHDSAIDTAEDEAFGIAVGDDGNPVFSGEVRVADGDDDIFVRKLDGVTGEPIWTETYTGEGNGTYSVDSGGPVAIGVDGSVYVAGQEYVTFNELYVVLLHFGADGGPPEWTYTPMRKGGLQEYEPLDVGVDDSGNAYVTMRWISGAVNTFIVDRVDANGRFQWTADQTAFASDSGEDWSIVGADPSATGELVVAGQVTIEGDESSWFESWVARLDENGRPICQIQQQGPQDSLLPSSLRPRAVGSALDGAPLLGAQLTEEGGESLWIGRFLVN
jgi:cysteine-rich repeat protein